MYFVLRIALSVVVVSLLVSPSFAGEKRTVDEVKADIFSLAQSYSGQGDPDRSKQAALTVLVDELLELSPQPPVEERLETLHGPWKQVWGRYDYRKGDRGVDPKMTIDEIYQVVFPGGYYYNVNPYKGNKGAIVSLLRGEYTFVEGYPNMIKGRFTEFPGNRGVPDDTDIWKLASMAENDTLPERTTVVPTIIVWLFFGSGYLREAYTDDTLRISYGAGDLDDRDDEYIYVMTRPWLYDGLAEKTNPQTN